MQLIDCFQSDFAQWLSKSNSKKVRHFIQYSHIIENEYKKSLAENLIKEALDDILQILLKEPEADYFWYTYPENGGELTYSLPHHDVVPSDAIRINKDKLKIFLRDYKLEKLLCQTKDLN